MWKCNQASVIIIIYAERKRGKLYYGLHESV